MANLISTAADDTRLLLHFYLMERALVELRHELTERPEWVRIPAHGLLEILDSR